MASYEKNKQKFKVSKLIIYIILIILAVIYVAPLLWVIMASFKNNTTLMTDPFGWPNPLNFDNYVTAWVGGGIGGYFLNSVIVVGCTLVISILINCMAAYGMARMKWKLSGAAMVFFLTGMMVPIHATLIPLYTMFSAIGFLNSYLSLIVPYVVFTFGQSIYIMRGFLWKYSEGNGRSCCY